MKSKAEGVGPCQLDSAEEHGSHPLRPVAVMGSGTAAWLPERLAHAAAICSFSKNRTPVPRRILAGSLASYNSGIANLCYRERL